MHIEEQGLSLGPVTMLNYGSGDAQERDGKNVMSEAAGGAD